MCVNTKSSGSVLFSRNLIQTRGKSTPPAFLTVYKWKIPWTQLMSKAEIYCTVIIFCFPLRFAFEGLGVVMWPRDEASLWLQLSDKKISNFNWSLNNQLINRRVCNRSDNRLSKFLNKKYQNSTCFDMNICCFPYSFMILVVIEYLWALDNWSDFNKQVKNATWGSGTLC